jgi:Fungal chitosanase of glycosyl hydrolase group 75
MARGLVLGLLLAACGSDDAPPDAPVDGPAPLASRLLARIASCDPRIGGPYAPDVGEPATVSICGLPGAVSWTAELDVDCDGKRSAKCNTTTDPSYQDQTAATDSNGDPLDAAALPFVVVPGASTRFDYRAAGLAMGSVFAVIHRDRIEYGIAGDVGPSAIIGEASYRMAELLGIDPDPSTGGTDEPVAYIGFTGAGAIVAPIDDHERAVSLGRELATALSEARRSSAGW